MKKESLDYNDTGWGWCFTILGGLFFLFGLGGGLVGSFFCLFFFHQAKACQQMVVDLLFFKPKAIIKIIIKAIS